MTSPRPSSSSLFKHEDDACHSLEKAQAKIRAEKQRRMKLFRRVGLPLCLAGVLVVAFVLKDPVISIFKEDHMIQQYMEKEHQHGQGKEQARTLSVKTYGRPKALLRIELTLPAEGRGVREFSEAILEAVDTKPSEICLVWRQEADAEPALLVNGKNRLEIEEDGKRQAVVLKPLMNLLALKQALNGVHAAVYGKNVLHPLHLTASAEEKKMQEEAAEYLPEFVGSRKDLKDQNKQTLLPLPQADTGVVPSKVRQ